MNAPAWLSWRGLAEHVAAGAAFTILIRGLGCPQFSTVLAVALIAVVHEQAQTDFSDFRRANGGPWNGLLDVATFLVVPIAAWLG